MMFDAEIAAVLLNRRKLTGDAAVALLREGNMSFTREAGRLHPQLLHDAERVRGETVQTDLECLLFADGSRVLRIAGAAGADWTRWSAIEPAVTRAERLLGDQVHDPRSESLGLA